MEHATQRASWLFNISESIEVALALTYKLSNVLIELTHLKDQPQQINRFHFSCALRRALHILLLGFCSLKILPWHRAVCTIVEQ